MIESCTVMLLAVPLTENVSSRPQETETWSNTMFAPWAIVTASAPLSPTTPMRIRM
jgi:hypothetical protein